MVGSFILKKEECKRDHITPLLNKLHLLPVKFLLEHKIAILAYCYFDITFPSHILALLGTYQTFAHPPILMFPKFPGHNLKTVG